MKIGIVTTTYNRRKLLERLYASLCEQIDEEFTWIIVDDGSTDDTSSYIETLNSNFELRYYQIQNGGKARALNYAFANNKDIDLYVVIDSDDYLLEIAVAMIKKTAIEYQADNIGGLFFRYQYEEGQILGHDKNVYENVSILSRIEHDANYDKVDGCICYFNQAVQEYRYPEFEEEKYVGPTVIQMEMSDDYKVVFTNHVIGVAEYQESGLTRSGRKLRLKNPKGMLVYSHYMQDEAFDLLTRVKYGIMANAYVSIIGNDSDIDIKDYRIPVYYKPFGKFLAKYWLRKHNI